MANNKKKVSIFKRHRKLVITFASLAAVGIVLIVILVIATLVSIDKQARAQAAAAAAEKARIAADPIGTNGIYTALNKERATTGAPALSTVSNLTTSAEQYCNDMVTYKYFDYKNPTTGKESNSFVKDNGGDLYLPSFVMTIFSGNVTSQTSSDIVGLAVSKQATNLNNPSFNSVGWAVCQSPTDPNIKYVAGALADKEQKPAAPTNVYKYVPTYSPPSPTHCYTTYNNYDGYLSPTATTNCY